MKKLLLLLALCCVCGTITAQNTKPQAVIFETDMGNDIDDAMALDLLFNLGPEAPLYLRSAGAALAPRIASTL